MDRPLFDPKKMAARKEPSAPPGILTVAQLSAKLDTTLREGFPNSVRVTGEISGFRDRTHWYFDLKDADAVISCVMFQSVARRAGIQPENGLQVVIKGRIEYYAKQGKVSLLAESIEPVGAGALDLAFRKLLEEVRALGWLDPERKRPLPRFPRRIAIITSRTGAALQDVLVTMRRRAPGVAIVLVDARVQGDTAAAEITAAIREVSARAVELSLDALLITRGGGSKEDLWSFNDRALSEAILQCSIPVVAAIGHETDTTLAELVADERCATPTQAAMRLTPDSGELLRQVDSLNARLENQMWRRLSLTRREVDSLANRPALRDPRSMIVDRRERLTACEGDLTDTMHRRFERLNHQIRLAAASLDRHRPQALHAGKRSLVETLARRLEVAIRARTCKVDMAEKTERLTLAIHNASKSAHAAAEAADRQLRAVSPLRVLDRGFSVTTSQDGRIVRSASSVQSGDQLTTRVADGQFDSIAQPKDGSRVPLREQSAPIQQPAAPRRATKSASDNDQEGLFGRS